MSASAVNFSSGRLRFWQTTVGKKAIMAVTGIILFGFVVGHLIGNLQIFLPPEKINRYAATLRAFPFSCGLRGSPYSFPSVCTSGRLSSSGYFSAKPGLSTT